MFQIVFWLSSVNDHVSIVVVELKLINLLYARPSFQVGGRRGGGGDDEDGAFCFWFSARDRRK